MSTAPARSGRCRFCRLYASFVAAFSLLFASGLVLSLLAFAGGGGGAGLGAGDSRLLPRVVYAIAPVASGSALLLALALAALPRFRGDVTMPVRWLVRRGAWVALPGYLVTLGLTLGVSWLLTRLHPGWSRVLDVSALSIRDFELAGLYLVLDSAAVLSLAWRRFEALQQATAPLAAKLLGVFSMSLPPRVILGVAFSLLLPG